MKVLLTTLFLLSVQSQIAMGTAFTLFKANCAPQSGGDSYHVHYYSASAPGGPVSYWLALSQETSLAIVKLQAPPKLVNEALLLTGIQLRRGTVTGHVVLYARDDITMLDVQLADNNKMNTKGPILLSCKSE